MSLEASELAALEHLQAAGPMTQKHLGERLSLSPGAVTAMIDRLESRGYVERIPNPEDRRSALVLITKAGLEASLRHLWPYIEDMKAFEEGFSEEGASGDCTLLKGSCASYPPGGRRGR
jgi:DNA-binding MarR family transcriptional regulator